MITQVLPIFTEAHILRREMLSALSDFAVLGNQLIHLGYADGILAGCELKATKDKIILNSGVICFHGKLYLIKEPVSVPYEETNLTHLCKLVFIQEMRSDNFIKQEINLIITKEVSMKEGEMELCRFKLQHGARLRYEYVNFDDRATEYDTLNTIHTPYASKGSSTLSPEILKAFASQLLKLPGATDFDAMFSVQVLGRAEALGREGIAAYIRHRRQQEVEKMDNFSLYQQLAMILGEAEHGKDSSTSTQKKNKWKIMVD